MRRLLTLLTLLVLACCCTAQAATKAPRPNILFFLADDLGYGDLGCYGHPVIKTPTLDRLAADGLRLTDYYAPSPVCSPSRAGLMTGRDPNRVGIPDWIEQGSGVYLKRDEVTVAKLLKTAGYRTGIMGKWHLSSKFNGQEPTPGDHGFDYWCVTQNNAAPTHQNPGNFVRMGKRVGPMMGNSSTILTDEAIRFIRETKDQPFAAFVTFHATHEQVAVPEEWSAKYPGLDDPNRAVYYGCVSLMDHEIGRVLKTLDELKLRDNTLIVFTSDNGPEALRRYEKGVHSFGSAGPLRGMKLHVTDGGIRVPAIVQWKGHVRPRVSAEPVTGLDFLPTFCELAGATPAADHPLDGASITALFDGKPVARTRPLYWQYDHSLSEPWHVAVRDGEWKLLSTPKLDRFALYNLARDRGEATDLSTSEPERVRKMAAEMRRLYRGVNGHEP